MELERAVRGLGRVRRLRTLEFRKRPALDIGSPPTHGARIAGREEPSKSPLHRGPTYDFRYFAERLRRIVKEFRASDLSRSRFCESRGLDIRTLSPWLESMSTFRRGFSSLLGKSHIQSPGSHRGPDISYDG